MSTQDKQKCFTYTWHIENFTYCWQKPNGFVSPKFQLNPRQEFKYHLILYPYGIMDKTRIRVFLESPTDLFLNEIDCELAFLSKDGAVLISGKRNDSCLFIERKEVLVVNRSVYLPEDVLTIRCRMWMRGDGMADDVQTFARTRICVRKETFLWNIHNFSNLHSEQKCTYEIKSVVNDEVLMALDLSLENPYTDEDSITIRLVSENGKIKYCVFHLMPLNGVGSAYKCIRKEFLFNENKKSKLFNLPFSKKKLIANKNICLPNDVLSFQCKCTFSTGNVMEEIESVIYGKTKCSFSTREIKNFCSDDKSILSTSKRILNENLKSLLTDNILSDIKLKTSSETILAHKNILSARSPVFKEMFSNNRTEKYNKCVDIEDLNSDTVHRMLQYIYTAEIKVWKWEDAFDLYRAADKYKILSLRNKCSAYLKSNLSPNNACAVLILADLHEDEDLKAPVQEFIFTHDIMNSEGWKGLMKTHVKLAADTMYLQIQRKALKFPSESDMKSAMTLSTAPRFESTISKTTTASFGLNSSIISIPSTSKGLNISTAEKPSISCLFGNNGQESLYKPFSFGSSIEKAPVNTLSLFSSSSNKEPVNIPFSFVRNSDKVPAKPSLSFGNNRGKEPSKPSVSLSSRDMEIVKPSFCFGSSSEGVSANTFSFGNINKKEPISLPSLFVSNIEKKSVKSTFLFGENREKEPVKPSFSFSSSDKMASEEQSYANGDGKKPVKECISCSDEKEPIKQSFSSSDGKELIKQSFPSSDGKEPVKNLDNNDEKKTVKPSFFCSCTERDPIKAQFMLGSCSEKPPCYTFSLFGSSNKKKPINIPFSFDSNSTKRSVKPSFLNDTNSEQEPSKPSFSIKNSNEKKPIKASFQFACSDKKESVKPFFSLDKNSAKEPVNPSFSFRNNSEKEPSKPSFSFGRCEKKSAKSSFSFGSSEEKEPVNQFPFSSSCVEAPSRFNSGTRLAPGLDSSSAMTICPANGPDSAETHSKHPMFDSSNATTSLALPGFKSSNGEKFAASEYGSSIVETSIASNGINCNIGVKSSATFFSFGSVGEKDFSPSSGFNSSNEETNFSSPASNASSIETHVSSRLANSSPKIQSDSSIISNENKLSLPEAS